MNRSPIAVARNTTTTNGCAMNGVGLLNATKDSFNVSKHSCSSPLTTLHNDHNDKTNKVKNPEMAAKLIKQSNIVCFDVDSTVIKEEGIDELADFCGKGSEVSRVTKEAMGGSMTFQDALRIRLNIIRPSQSQVEEFKKLRPSVLTDGVKQFIGYLKAEGKQVYLISGGFDSLIEPVATELNIPMSNVYANKLLFSENGDYADFDTTKPTSRSGGKSEAVAIVKRQNDASSVITMIGDGATDLEAVPPADYFIGFGGNVVRTEVFNRAKYYVTDFDQLWAAKNE